MKIYDILQAADVNIMNAPLKFDSRHGSFFMLIPVLLHYISSNPSDSLLRKYLSHY